MIIQYNKNMFKLKFRNSPRIIKNNKCYKLQTFQVQYYMISKKLKANFLK